MQVQNCLELNKTKASKLLICNSTRYVQANVRNLVLITIILYTGNNMSLIRIAVEQILKNNVKLTK